jgi:hypothetical protein
VTQFRWISDWRQPWPICVPSLASTSTNLTEKNLFAGQCKEKSPTPFVAADWSSKAALPLAEWEKQIKAKINACNILIVLAGTNTATATGVAREIQFAKDQNVPVFGVYVAGAGTASNLPVGLQRNRTVSWTWPSVGAIMKQAMGEGKNNY